MESTILELVKQVGPVLTCLGFFIWRDYVREAQQRAVNANQTAFIQETLVGLVEEVTKALTNNTQAISHCMQKTRG